MYNDFIVACPVSDPAGIKGGREVLAAFRKIAASSVKFISRGDNSGTDLMEKSYWKAAGVKPPANLWTIDKLRDVLRGEKFKSLPRNEAQRALIEQFAIEKVNVQELAKDAVARDQALDAFERFAGEKVQTRRQARQTQLRQLQDQLDRLQREGQQEEQQWQQWQAKKNEYEKEMAWAIGYLLDNPIITTNDK